MPWVRQEDCTGCGDCIEGCPVEAISMINEKAAIDMEECIRCAICHDICPEEAVRHDSETVPVEIEANVIRTKKAMEACASYFGNPEEAQKCLKRWIKHYNREKMVAEKTGAEIQSLQETS
ncbi:MAG: 4Fe-4S binding protein [Thermotogota bacterium]|nr:4Fe-4S binding protein [Thermotogota bacterium]